MGLSELKDKLRQNIDSRFNPWQKIGKRVSMAPSFLIINLKFNFAHNLLGWSPRKVGKLSILIGPNPLMYTKCIVSTQILKN